MLDFIKNNKLISGAVASMVLIIIIIIILFLISGNPNEDGSETQPFPDTGALDTAGFASSSGDVFLFGTSSERFVSEGEDGEEVPEFRAVTKTPVIGASMFLRPEGRKMIQYIRYTSRNNGHIFDIPLATLGEEVNVSNKTVLRIGNSKWSSNGSSTFSRYFNEDDTRMFSYLNYVTLGTSSKSTIAPYEFVGRPYIENIQDVAFSPSGDELFYLVTTSEGSVGYLENVATGAKKQVWTSLLRNLSVSWNAQSTILIYTNPSSQAEGVVWMLNTKSNTSDVVLVKSLALAAKTNPSGTKILYSLQESKNSIFSLRVLDIETGETNYLPIATMVEKCTWGPMSSKYIYCALPRKELSGDMLEDWYMGILGSNDVLWRIDSATGVVKRLFDPQKETGEEFDIVNLTVSPKEDFLIFRTRVNSILWALKLPTKPSVKPEGEEEVGVVED